MKVAGSVGVITGGGGGLGGGVARMLVEGGGKAVILDLESSGGAELAASLGPNALFIPTDVTDSTQIERAIEQAVEQAGRIDLCVNAAGISPAHRVVDRKGRVHPLEVFEKTIDVNLIGAFDVLRHAAKA